MDALPFFSSLIGPSPSGDGNNASQHKHSYKCICGAQRPSESCGDALSHGWINRHWPALSRLLEDHVLPADASVEEVVAANTSIDVARLDLLQTLDFDIWHQPRKSNWFRKKGPTIAQALACYIDTRVTLAQAMANNRDLAVVLSTTFDNLYNRYHDEDIQHGTNNTNNANGNLLSNSHVASNTSNIVVLDSDSELEGDSGTSDVSNASNTVILVYDSDDCDEYGPFRAHERKDSQ